MPEIVPVEALPLPALSGGEETSIAGLQSPPVDEASSKTVVTAPLAVAPQLTGQDSSPETSPDPAESAPPSVTEGVVQAPAEDIEPKPRKPAAKATHREAKPTAEPAPKVAEPPSQVQTRLADAPAEVDGYKVNLNDMRPPALKRTPPKGTPRTLAETILSAISDNALIKVGEGTAAEALAAIGTASSALYPQLQGRVGLGPNGVTSWQASRGPGTEYFNRKNAYGALRGDFGVTGEQLIYDFGSTQSSITKAAAGAEAQNWSVLSTTEEVAFKTASAYLKILEQRELLDLSGENLASLEEIANLVNENQKNGNGTVADVKRVGARVIDAASAKADQEYALKLASDDLRRLIQMDPGPLSAPPTLSRFVPANEVKALADALKTNPRILSYRASIDARQAEIRSIKQGNLPKVVAEVSATNKQYQAVNDKTDLDMSAMLAVRYKFLDGGFSASQIEGVQARMFQDEMRMRDTRETIESDLRRDYFTLKLARGKTSSLAEGVDLNTKARSLYREQFRGGKRSLLELLEVQNAFYLSKRSQITNQFEERRANFSILRSMGRFAVTALTFK